MRGAETKVWPGGEHPFRLGIGELRALEQRCDAGCAVVLMRLLGTSWKIDDVLSPLRLGLIGGGMAAPEAQRTLDSALEVASLYALAVYAADVLRCFIMWDGDDQPGEEVAGTATSPTRSQTDEPDGQPIMEQEPFSASAQPS